MRAFIIITGLMSGLICNPVNAATSVHEWFVSACTDYNGSAVLAVNCQSTGPSRPIAECLALTREMIKSCNKTGTGHADAMLICTTHPAYGATGPNGIKKTNCICNYPIIRKCPELDTAVSAVRG